MSSRHHAAVLAACALLGTCFAPPASAALWSSTNTVASMYEWATMEISLTGDQYVDAAQVDVVIPSSLTNVSATPLNRAGCNYIGSLGVVRIINDIGSAEPAPAFAQPVCSIRFRVMRSTSVWFTMRDAQCYTADGTLRPDGKCARDEGYLTVLN